MATDRNSSGEKRPVRWCDLSCEHAGFPLTDSIDGSWSCRTLMALWCRKLEKHVTKNSKCEAERGNDRT